MKSKNIYIIFALIVFQLSFAQKDQTVGTEVVNVVKPYTASISDAFKVKETPVLDDEINTKKEVIKYNIFSFPVASTFTPSKGKAASVEKSKKEQLFSNYLTLGFGNYGTPVAELFVTENLNRNEYVGGMLRHISSQGGIKELDLDDKFMNTSLDVTYGNQQKGTSWNADLGYQHQVYNWYGLSPTFLNGLTPQERDDAINGINEQQTYHNFYAAAKIGVDESIFKGASIKYNRFWDAYGSQENRLFLKPQFNFDISDTQIKANFIVDYLSGSTKNNFYTDEGIKYGFSNFGVQPSFVMNRDELTLNIGAAVFYSLDNQNSENKLFVYPQITASLKVVGDLMIFYAGAEGTLQQNTYRDFTNENPFLSPTNYIAPTDRQFDIYGGLKGKFAGNVSYNVRASLMSEKNKALFKYNIFDFNNSNKSGYTYGNSFGIVYDDVKTLGFFGEVKADFSKNVSFGLNANLATFTSKYEEEAWNLPSLKLGSNLDITISKKWSTGINVFFTGERKDQILMPNLEFETVTLKSFFDANANIVYRHNERLSFFLKGNNLGSQGYQKWLYFPVQSLQILGGANYKFDF